MKIFGKREHRRIHTQIKEEVGENFDNLYYNYEECKGGLIQNLKIANGKISSLKKGKIGEIEIENQRRAQLEPEKLEHETAKADWELEKVKVEVANKKEIANQEFSIKRGKI